MQAKIVFLLLLSILTGFNSVGQSRNQANRHSKVLEISTQQYQPQLFEKSDRNYFETSIAVPDFEDCPFVAMSVSWEQLNENGEIKYLLYKYGQGPALLPKNHHFDHPENEHSSDLVYLPFDDHVLQLKIITTGKPELILKVHFFNPGFTDKITTNQSAPAAHRSAICPCPQPEYLTRGQWCPNGQCPPHPAPETTLARHLIIHHSAGTNVSSDWPAIVRSIWDYHVNTQGWADIGYNWLVDPEGNLYEGRGKDIKGAHFCGGNSQTMGICMMGNYTDVAPQAAALATLTEMLAWNCCEDAIDPLGVGPHSGSGLELYRISGHRDGCSTLCPGDTFYPLLPALRVDVADHIDQVCTVGQTDILVESLYTDPAEVYVDETIVLFAKVKNVGNIVADSIAVTRTLNGTILTTNVITSLEAGETETLAFTYVFDEEGTSTFCMEIEPLVDEISVDNNTSCVDINVASLVNSKEFASNLFSIQPNPSSGVFFVDFQKAQSGIVEVLSSEGKLVYQSIISESTRHRVQLEHIASGIYVLKLKADDQFYLKKIVIQ